MGSDWGFATATHSRGTAGTVSGTVVAANANRKYLHIRNELGGPVYLYFGGAATISNGALRLNGVGSAGNELELSKGKGNVYTGRIEAICTGATAYLDILEGT